jgi:hypothetical protein
LFSYPTLSSGPLVALCESISLRMTIKPRAHRRFLIAGARERTKGLTLPYLRRGVLTAKGMVDDNQRSQRVSPFCPLEDFQRGPHANNPGG